MNWIDIDDWKVKLIKGFATDNKLAISPAQQEDVVALIREGRACYNELEILLGPWRAVEFVKYVEKRGKVYGCCFTPQKGIALQERAK